MNDQSASELRAQAARCRRLANSIYDNRTRDILESTAKEFENEAKAHDSPTGAANGGVGPGNQ